MTYIHPTGGRFDPLGNDTLWIVITVREVTSLTNNVREKGNYIETGAIKETYRLIAPNDISEVMNHSWDDYENSMVGRATDIAKTGSAIMKEGSEVLPGAYNAKNIKDMLNVNILEQAGSKVDKPLAYTGSDRLQYPFSFVFADQGDPENDVMKVPNDFRRWSSPRKNESSLSIQFPYICEVQSDPPGIVHLSHAAITSVQTTYTGPYRGGMPSKCELILTFKDMSPLFQSSWDNNNSIVTTG